MRRLILICLLTSSLATAVNTETKRSSLKLTPIPLGGLRLTAYRSVKAQTDSTPFWTSIGVHTNPFIVAVSQDMLKDGRVKYGDTIYIEGIGFKTVADCMNKRHHNSVDVWVETKVQERAIKIRVVQVWKIKGIYNE